MPTPPETVICSVTEQTAEEPLFANVKLYCPPPCQLDTVETDTLTPETDPPPDDPPPPPDEPPPPDGAGVVV